MKRTIPLLAAIASIALASCGAQDGSYPAHCQQQLEGWRGTEDGLAEDAVWILVRIHKAGAVSWNGQPITDEILTTYLDQLSDRGPRLQIGLAIQPGASCSRVRQVRTLMNASRICSKDAACGEGADWENPGGRQIS